MQLIKYWRTSSYTAANEACVEVGATTGAVVVQDSKHKFRGEVSPVLEFGAAAFGGLLARVKAGELDLA